MTQIVDLTITKADDATSLTFKAMVPSSGDRTPSIHREDADTLPGHRGTLQIVSRWNAARTARRVELVFDQPYTRDVNGDEVSDSKSVGSLSFVLPQDIPESEIQEHVNNVVKLLGSDMVMSVLETGYAPT